MDDDAYQPDPRRWRALTVCLSAGFMTLLDVSIVNVALPSIRAGLQASPGQLQWVLAGYSLAFGLVLVPAERVGASTTRRRPGGGCSWSTCRWVRPRCCWPGGCCPATGAVTSCAGRAWTRSVP